MFNNNTYPAYVSEDHVDEILGELTELADNRDWVQAMWASSSAKLNNLRDELTDFVRDSSDVTDARAILEALCEQFALDAEREVTARLTITVNVVANAPYTMSIDEVSQALADINVEIESWNTDLDISTDVADIYVEDLQEQ